LTILRDDYGLIPDNVEIPVFPTTLNSIELEPTPGTLLGRASALKKQHHTPDNKLLIDISWSRTDADYLDSIRYELHQKRNILHDALILWWTQICTHYQYGKTLIEQVDKQEIRTALRNVTPNRKRKLSRDYVGDGRSEQSWGKILTILQSQHESRLSKKVLESSPYLPSLSTLKLPDSMPDAVSPRVNTNRRMNWMVGNLSRFDIAAICALLIMHNPIFTSSSIRCASLFDKDGNLYLEEGDTGTKFRIPKHRSKSFKDSPLD
jgi:hypothetical protein